MKYTKEQVLKIVDSCFNMYASDYRSDAKDNAIEIMKGMDNQNVSNDAESNDGKLPIFDVIKALIAFFKWREGQQLTADTILEIETFAKEYESNL